MKMPKNERRFTPEKIDTLSPNEIFVFGSNLSGMHGAGAAWAAKQKFGAIMGKGVGIQGQSYAIPTMQGSIKTIAPYVNDFINFARQHPKLTFLVTRIGCGIAGFQPKDIAPLFAPAIGLDNVVLPREFVEVIKTMYTKTQVFNVIILDSSGSMGFIKQGAIDGFNETIAEIKKAQKQYADTQQHLVSLISFCSYKTEHIYDKTPVDNVAPLTDDRYYTCGGTPLFDAIGLTAENMRKHVRDIDNAVVVVTIITDGEENSSHHYRSYDIQQLIKELREEGWTFTYIGANQDAEKVAISLSITQSLNFDYNEKDTREIMEQDCEVRRCFYDRLHKERSQGTQLNKKAMTQLAEEAFDTRERNRRNKPKKQKNHSKNQPKNQSKNQPKN